MLAEPLPIETPAFLYDETRIEADCIRVARLAHDSGCKLLFSVKALSIAGVLEIIARHVDGFSTSSLFETMLVRKVVGDAAVVHATSPGLRPQDLSEIARSSQFLSCNSIYQFERAALDTVNGVQLGIRINPGISLLSDPRYDPCRPHSKLGASLEEISSLPYRAPLLAERLSGLLVHNNCDAEGFGGLLQTVKHLATTAKSIFPLLAWINLGGGYTFRSSGGDAEFLESIAYLRTRYDLSVYLEPGAALVRNGAQLVASVLDLFEREGKAIAVLDTSVNHMPEVFEYQDLPDSGPWVSGHVENGQFSYLLVGCSCLAGDIFGDYAFDSRLAIGDQIVFPEMGAYSFSKAHWFNGVNLPNIYAKSSDGRIKLKQRFAFSDYARHNGVVAGGVDHAAG